MTSHTENWTYAEFHAFAMLYAANADGRITLEEENLIIPTLPPEDYARIKAAFMACDDAVALDVILSYRDQYCRSQSDKDKILADMLAIYQANAAFDQIERGVHQLFKRML
ncbi:MAG: hypothetical protein ABIQ93_12870 [Saprospiraceae bacterium]